MTEVGVIVTVEVTPPADAVAVTGANPEPRLKKIGKFTASRVGGGLICTTVGFNGVDANACCANCTGLGP